MTDPTAPTAPTDPRIYPTHSCFDDALTFFDECVPVTDIVKYQHHFRVVHALCTWPDPSDPRPYAHAWVEESQPDGVVCWQAGVRFGARIYYGMPRTKCLQYHRLHTPTSVTRYTLRQAAELNTRTNHSGPWVDAYRAACGAGVARRGIFARPDVELGPLFIISPAPAPGTHPKHKKAK